MKRLIPTSSLALAVLLALMALPGACNRSTAIVEDGQSHWLGTCSASIPCPDDLECVCGVCTRPCSDDTSCDVEGRQTTCAAEGSLAVAEVCGSRAPRSVCLEGCSGDDDCGASERCVDSYCVPSATAMGSGGEGGSSNGGAGNGSTSSGGESQVGGAAGTSANVGGTGTATSCTKLMVPECEAAGCALVTGWEVTGELAGTQQQYACQDPEQSCPPSGVCAHDPEDTNHVVWFGNCAPEGWLPDRGDPSACEDLVTIDCTALRETACNSQPGCMSHYGTAVDGSSVFAGCAAAAARAPRDPVCAIDESGRHLMFSASPIPDGWTIEDGIAGCYYPCYSPYHDANAINDVEYGPCPCSRPGAACVDGVGLRCEDVTDDLRYDPSWQRWDEACDDSEPCEGDLGLQDCLERFETCRESGTIVLDVGTRLYCGTAPLECELRTERTCDGECYALVGTSASGDEAYAGCVGAFFCEEADTEPLCIQNSLDLDAGGDAEPVYTKNLCQAPGGWAALDLAECTSAIQLDCATLDEKSCEAPCAPQLGVTLRGDGSQFFGCTYPPCNLSRVVCARNDAGDLAELFGCLAPGWTEVDASECEP